MAIEELHLESSGLIRNSRRRLHVSLVIGCVLNFQTCSNPEVLVLGERQTDVVSVVPEKILSRKWKHSCPFGLRTRLAALGPDKG